VKKILLISGGVVSLIFGGAGILLPVLPAAPFVLLSAGCFASGSPRMLQWLRKSRFFGSYIDNYRAGSGVPLNIKRKSIIFLWTGLIVSMVLVRTFWIVPLLTVVGAGVTAHIAMLKTKDDDEGGGV